MRSIVSVTQAVMGKAWWWLRQVSGDAAYDNYLRRALRGEATCAGPSLSREQYYLDALRRRYTTIARCC